MHPLLIEKTTKATMSMQYFTLTITSSFAKHIDIKFYVVKEQIQDYTISLECMSTKKMLANPLIKGLPHNVFREHLAGMGLRETL